MLRTFLFALSVSLSLAMAIVLPSNAAESLGEVVEAMATRGVKVKTEQLAAVRGHVISEPDSAFKLGVRKLKSKKTSTAERAVWVWVLGLTGRTDAVGHLINQVTPEAPAILRANVDNALGEIGGDEAGEFLYREYIGANSDAYKNHLLVLMSRASYEPAISKSTELLKLDQYKSQYKAVYFYGTMGEASVPFLINKLDHWSPSVRKNAALMLGQWFLAQEATKPIISRYAKEEDHSVRGKLLDALERTMVDLRALEQFMKKVEKEEKDGLVRRFARESIKYVPRMREAIKLRYGERRPDQKSFKKAYDDLYNSKGARGSFRALGLTSDFQDESALALLRARILRRGTPESVYDAQKINRIILINRLIKSEGLG